MTTFGLAATILLAGAGATPTIVRVESAPEWNARFAGQHGWIGGDGVASARLGGERALWLFSDTLVGEVTDGKRNAAMVNNSIAMQTGRGKDAALRFVFGKSAQDDKPKAFVAPTDDRSWFWPMSAIRIQNKLYVFLAQIERTDAKGAFGFRHFSQTLALVTNPDDEPEKWRVQLRRLPFVEFTAVQERSWGSAVLVHGEYLYVYGYLDAARRLGSRKLSVARVPVNKIEDSSAWRFRLKDSWGEAKDAVPLAGGLATEFSVCPLPGGKGFVLIYTESGLSERILARFAQAPDGPWSEPTLVYRCPEAKDKGIFTYAAKAHPWASARNELLVSYCTNAWDFGRLFRDPSAYRPKFIRVTFGYAGRE